MVKLFLGLRHVTNAINTLTGLRAFLGRACILILPMIKVNAFALCGFKIT
jgi:hypothetical protein